MRAVGLGAFGVEVERVFLDREAALLRHGALASRPARMIPVKGRSMMKVVPQPKRWSENGARIMVPNWVIRSPRMCTKIAAHTTG